MLGELLPVQAWLRNPALRSWPLLLFVALVAVPPAGLVILGPTPTMASFSDASWLFAAYFAVAWLLLIGVIVRPAQVTKRLLLVVVVVALVTQIPLAVALENALHANTSNLLSSIFAIGLPEELAKAIPVAVIAVALRNRLSPVDYLFLGAVSGLVFGASEVEQYITAGVGVGQVDAGPLILSYLWRFVTDPVTHACWAGLTGYFIGLAVSGTYSWQRVGWIGLAMAMILHGLNDWDAINGHDTWVVVVAVSGILLVAYAKAGPATAQSVPAQSAAVQYVPGQPSAPPGPAMPAHGGFPAPASPPPGPAPAPAAAWYAAQPGQPPAPPTPSAPPPTQPAGGGRGWSWQGAIGTQPTVTVPPPRGPQPPAPGRKPWWEE
jgi:RsiW-degrading membrane proteinase PrsW (M82 family)